MSEKTTTNPTTTIAMPSRTVKNQAREEFQNEFRIERAVGKVCLDLHFMKSL
ncbi:MAG: hypothetical protein ABII71_02715 [Candidatus Micrarchaeota archaeon]